MQSKVVKNGRILGYNHNYSHNYNHDYNYNHDHDKSKKICGRGTTFPKNRKGGTRCH